MRFLIESENKIVYHNTYPNKLESILKYGLLVSKSNSEDVSGFKCIWATDKPSRLEFGGVTLKIELTPDIRYEKDENYYLIYDDIKPQYIKVIDYPLFKNKLTYKVSDIRNLVNRYSKDKIKEMISAYQDDLIYGLDKTKQLTSFLDWNN